MSRAIALTKTGHIFNASIQPPCQRCTKWAEDRAREMRHAIFDMAVEAGKLLATLRA